MQISITRMECLLLKVSFLSGLRSVTIFSEIWLDLISGCTKTTVSRTPQHWGSYCNVFVILVKCVRLWLTADTSTFSPWSNKPCRPEEKLQNDSCEQAFFSKRSASHSSVTESRHRNGKQSIPLAFICADSKEKTVWLRYHRPEACTRAGSTISNDSSAELLLTSSAQRGKKDRGVKVMRGEQKSETWTKSEWFMQKIELAWCSAERRPTELMRSAARLSPATTFFFNFKTTSLLLKLTVL